MTLGMRKAEELQLADKLGIPHELISFIQRDREVILALYQEKQQKKAPLPSSITNDPARRTDKAVEAAYNTTVKKYKKVSINRMRKISSCRLRCLYIGIYASHKGI